MQMKELTIRREPLTWIGGVGAFLVATVGTVAMGLSGLIFGIVFLLVWYAVPTLYTVAFGQLVVVALFADTVGVRYLVPLELGLLVVLAGSAATLDHPRWRALATSGLAVGLGAATLASYRWTGDYWLAIGVVVITFALAAYGMHRYECVKLGLVEDIP
ncbi:MULTISPECIES: hypothetical protein [unclassified Haladaptatus]|uniref:hypothetical protein n=1 Tax=unclassified Haladaptatus TaxID=2622732 RepID=UPI00209C1395|nr:MULTISPECIES: hypothetical protein [unclassified Haladaptatus]MCO8244757.1 hypothetical protein [Haladaptatus sp. AB643]MCO8255731.1 hypothetical protein [Haladaptatus sp. AB618]